jgi:probable LLM family oxidoreductase
MELGVFTFVPRDNGPIDPATDSLRLRELIEQAALADELGLDVFGIGEHHRPDYLASAPGVILAAIAARTERILLTSAVTVLGSEDPVRVFQNFATLDLISNGRAEIMAGRGSFIESFPLFGYDLDNYDELFAEKLELLLTIRENEIVTWKGTHRASIDARGVYPRSLQAPLPVWLAVGGNPPSAVRAGELGLPMALAIIGGLPERFVGFTELFRESARRSGHENLPLSINSHGYIAPTSQQALDESFMPMSITMNRIGRERGWQPMTRPQFDASATLRGANFIGSPEQVIEKILYQHDLFHHDRFLIQFSVGVLPHDKLMRAIELFGTQVAPVVRAELQAK